MKTIFSFTIMFGIACITHLAAQPLEGINPEHLPAPTATVLEPVIKTIELPAKITLEYAEQGKPDGIPVILLHGYTDSWHSFEMLLPYLPASLHVYAVSQRGHGNSSKPLQGYHPDDFAKDIAFFIHQLGIKNAILVGHSMGSTIVQSFAVSYPGISGAIILTGAFAAYDKPEVMEFKKLIDQLADPVDTAFAAGFQTGTAVRPIPEVMMKKFIEETAKVPAFVWKGVAAGWATSNYTGKLKNYNNPALIVWGDKDIFCSNADQLLLKRSLKKSKLVVYGGTGHALHWEEPERFAKDMVHFIHSINNKNDKK